MTTRPQGFLIALLTATLLLTGCDSGGGETHFLRKAPSADDIALYCKAKGDHDMRCGVGSADLVAAECRMNPGVMRTYGQGVIEEYAKCFQTIACDQNTDKCLDQVLANLNLKIEDDPLASRCSAKSQQCGDTLPNVDCVIVLKQCDPARAAVEACFNNAALSCADLNTCITNPTF